MSPERRHSHLGAFERLPSVAVQEIQINQEMAEGISDPMLQKWFDSDYLLQHAAMFSFSTKQGEVVLSQSSAMGRAAIFDVGDIMFDEYDNPYSMVTGKGVGKSVLQLAKRLGRNLEREHVTPQDVKNSIQDGDPLGLFGYDDALKELEVSNVLAGNGVRTGRVVANIVLDHNILRRMYDRRKDTSFLHVDQQLAKVEQNHDVATICVRLQAGERLNEYDEYNQKPGYFSLQNMRNRAVGLLLSEIQRKTPEGFAEQYFVDDIEAIQNSLEQIRHRRFSEYDRVQYARLLMQLYGLAYIHKKHIEIPGRGKIVKGFNYHDFDLGGYVHDWELTTKGITNNPILEYNDYTEFTVPFLSTEANILVRQSIIGRMEKMFYPLQTSIHDTDSAYYK